MADFYVYYRVRPGAEPLARQRVAELQGRIAADCGITGRLLRRRGDAEQWLEDYRDVADPDAFERCLDAAEQDAAPGEWLAAGSRRHRECFEVPR